MRKLFLARIRLRYKYKTDGSGSGDLKRTGTECYDKRQYKQFNDFKLRNKPNPILSILLVEMYVWPPPAQAETF